MSHIIYDSIYSMFACLQFGGVNSDCALTISTQIEMKNFWYLLWRFVGFVKNMFKFFCDLTSSGDTCDVYGCSLVVGSQYVMGYVQTLCI